MNQSTTLSLLLFSISLNNTDDLSEYEERIALLRRELSLMSVEKDNMFIMLSTQLIFFMQAGFAMLELGSVRSKNAMNILIKNLLDISCTTFIWFIVGQGLAQGDGGGDFAGNSNFAYGNQENQHRNWLFNWAFAGTAATIISGCLAERCQLMGQLTTSISLTGFIYPVVVHWTWAEGGWLTEHGQSDFAGSGIVHLLGGTCGLIGALFLGPRIGRFDPETFEEEFKPHNTGMVCLGTLILWFGWQGFNGGSALGISGANNILVQTVCMNTTISGAAGGLTVFLLSMWIDHVESVSELANGLLAGLVSITASCDASNPWVSLGIGIVGGIVYQSMSRQISWLEIDDPLDAFPVHGACGLWGCVASGLVHWLLRDGGQRAFKGCTLGALIIVGWTASCSVIVQTPLWYFNMLRVSADVEIKGLDEVFHGGLGQYIGAAHGFSKENSFFENESNKVDNDE